MNRPVAIAAAAAAVIAAAVGGYLWLQSDTPDAPSREPGGSPIGALPPEPEAPGAGDPAALEAEPPGKIEIAEAEPESSPPSTQSAKPGGEAVADPAAAPVAGLAGSPVAGANPGASPPDPLPPVAEEPSSAKAPPAPAEGVADNVDPTGAAPVRSPPAVPVEPPDEEAPAPGDESANGAVEPVHSLPGAPPSGPGEALPDKGTPAFVDKSVDAVDLPGPEPGYSPPGVAPAGSGDVPSEEAVTLESQADPSRLPGTPEGVVEAPDPAPDVAAPTPPGTGIARAPERATPADEPEISSSPPPPLAGATPPPGDAEMPDDSAAAVPPEEPDVSRQGERPLPEGGAASPDLVAMLEGGTAQPEPGAAPQPAPSGGATPGEIAPPSPDDGSKAARPPVSVSQAAGEPEFEAAQPVPATPVPGPLRAVREPAVTPSRLPPEPAESTPPDAGAPLGVPPAKDPVTDLSIALAPVPPGHTAREPAIAVAPVAPSTPPAVDPDVVVATPAAARPPAQTREAPPSAVAPAADAPAPASPDPAARFDAGASDVSRRGGEPNRGAAPFAILYEKNHIVVSGGTIPEGLVEAWIDGRPVGSVKAGPDGGWRIPIGGEPGLHRIAVEIAGPEGGVRRVESPIYIEDATRISVVGGLKVVQVGSNLWRIAREVYGRGARNMAIYEANRDQIRNPDVIFPGQILILPGAPSEG